MQKINRRSFLAVAGAAGAAAGCSINPAIVQDTSPNRPLQLVVPGAAGSRTGVAGRIVAAGLEKELGQPISVINHDGPPLPGHAALAAAPADGRTFGLITVDIATMHWRGLTELGPKDFTPLALMSEDPAGIHVRADAPWKQAKELTEYIRTNPGKLMVSGTGSGGIWHLSTVGWLAAAGMNADALPWVPSSGPAPALEDLAIDGVNVVVCSVPEVRATPGASKTKSLAVMAARRHPRYPDVPTVQEAIGLRYAAGAWRGVAAPKGLPPEQASKLAAALKKTWESREFKDAMSYRGFALMWGDAKQFAEYMETSDKKMGSIVKAAGIAKS